METVSARVFCEPGLAGAFVAFWACLDPTKHDGYRLLVAASEGGMDLVLQKSVAGVYTELGSHHEASGEEEQGVEMLVGGGEVQVKWNGLVVIAVADGTYSAGLTGLEGEHENAFGTVGFTVDGILVDNLRRTEDPLAFEKWVQLPWAANSGKCYSESFGWVPNTGLSGAYWNEKGEAGGGEEAPALVSLAASLVGWKSSLASGPYYYLHRGRAYLSGAIVNRESAEVGRTIFSGLPSAIRPASPQALLFPINPEATTDACNSSLELPRYWAATMHPDGTLTLDEEVPASLNAPPSSGTWYYESGITEPGVHTPQYTLEFTAELVLGNSSWPLAPLADSPTFSPLTVGGDVTGEGAEFSIHGSRVHLGGLVTATIDEARELVHTLPPGTGSGVPNSPRIDFTTAVLLGNPVPIGIYPEAAAQLWVESDSTIVPAGDDPPLAYFASRTLRGAHATPTGTTGGEDFHDEATGAVTTCPKASGPALECPREYVGSVGHTVHISDLLALCLPEPDWFLLHLGWFVNTTDAFLLSVYDAVAACEGLGKCPPSVAKSAAFTGPSTYTLLGEETEHDGYLKPSASLYKGSPHFSGAGGAAWEKHEVGAAGFLWKRAALGEYLATEFAPAVHGRGYHNIGCDVFFTITPFYDRRQMGLHSGDVLDFSDTGWEGATAEEAVGATEVAASSKGRVYSN